MRSCTSREDLMTDTRPSGNWAEASVSQAIETIQRYVLSPDNLGQHLRQMTEQLAQTMQPDEADACQPEDRSSRLQRAAHVLASFIHLGWGAVGPEKYAPRMVEMLRA